MAKPKQAYLWKKAPFIRLLSPLVAGIITAYYTAFSYSLLISLIVLVTITVAAYEFLNIRHKFIVRSAAGALYMSVIFLFGMLLFKASDIRNQETWFGNHLENAQGLIIKPLANPQPRKKTFKISAEIQSVIIADTVVTTRGNALFYFPKDSVVSGMKRGDIVLMKNNIRPIRNSGNPGSFNFEKFMADQNIYHQAFVKDDDWVFTGKNKQNFFERIISSSLDYSHAALEANIAGDRETALAKALITGDRGELDRDLVQAYSNTGVVHIMAISGLHLGLIYILLIRLCSLIPGIKDNGLARFIALLGGIWFFALMTGCSPSVMRSAVMFSFLALGIMRKRRITTYNFWAAAAFVLLCFNPLLLFHVGFQLSFLAVLGILVTQKPIYRWFCFQNKIVDYAWQLISVTLSAQLFTLPLCLYYFHQFPLLFIVVNLVAIPLASIGLWAGVILLMTAWIPYVAKIAGLVVDLVFRLMNDFVSYMSSFEFSVWKGFLPTVPETVALSLVIIFILGWFMQKSKTALMLALVNLILISISSVIRHRQMMLQNKVIVYNIPHTTAIDFISANQYSNVLYVPEGSEAGSLHQDILNSREFLRATGKMHNFKCVQIGDNELFVNGISFFHIKKAPELPVLHKKIQLDVIVLSGSPKVSIAEINRTFDVHLYVFTPSNKPYQIDKWKKECEELLLRSYDVTSEGALVLNH